MVRCNCRNPAVAGLLMLAFWCVGVGLCVDTAIRAPEVNLRHPAVTGSAAATVAWMFVALGFLVFGAEWAARFAWSLGFAMLLVHLGFAFGLGHGWSHAAAVEHVREVGGSGAGIVVNYLFAAVWGADVLLWWANPIKHKNRPRWVAWTVHGFLAFVVVNATVIFGPPERRVAYAVALGLLGGAFAWRRIAIGTVVSK